MKQFVIYAETEKFRVGSFIEICPDDIEKYTIHTEIKDNMIFGIVTNIRNNGSLEGKLINGDTNFDEVVMGGLNPYQTKDRIHFMWTKNELSKINIKKLYPELMLV